MKTKILVRATIIIVFFLSNISPSFASQAIPVPKAPVGAIDKADTDLFTGSAGYSYPIKLPKGTNDLTPEVSLSYNSGATKGLSQKAGAGWDLNQDFIERDVNFTPSNSDTGDDKFKLHFQGQSYDLVSVASESAYHTKIESHLNIKKLTSGASNDTGEYWQVITPDGTKYRFGQATNSELMCNTRSYVHRWNLDLVEDTHGNKIYYTYSESDGASFLTKIEYNSDKTRVVNFIYENNPYQRQVYVQGCSVKETSRLINIEVNKSNVDLPFTDLTSNNNNLANSGASFVTTSLPFGGSSQALDLEASESDKLVASDSSSLSITGPITIESWVKFESLPATGQLEIIASKPSSYYLGLQNDSGSYKLRAQYSTNGSYQSANDIMSSAWSPSTGTWYHLAVVIDPSVPNMKFYVDGSQLGSTITSNTGTSINNSSSSLYLGTLTGSDYLLDGQLDDVRIWNTARTGTQINNNKSSELTGSESGLAAYYSFDMQGGGSPLVHKFDLNYATATNSAQLLTSITEKGSTASASLPPTRFSYYPEVKGWKTTSVKWLDHIGIDAPLDSNNATLLDVNGDSLPDIVKSEGNGNNTWKVWKNTGVNFSPASETWINNVGVDVKLEMTRVRLLDVNGDSLPDIVTTVGVNNDRSTWNVFRNTGHNWNTNPDPWIDNAPIGAHLEDTDVFLADVDGDNLPEIIKTGNSTYWKVLKNTGSNWSTSYVNWTIPTGLNLTQNNVKLLDVNGDGLQDIVKTSVSGSNSTWNVYRNTGSGWEASPDPWINGVNLGDGDLTKDNVSLADVNGDGLPDIVRTIDAANTWEVLLNLGNSWSTSWVFWIETSDSVNVESDDTKVRIVDVDGDGRSDIVRGQPDCTSCSEDIYEVWSNKGNSTDLLSTITTSLGGLTSFEYASTSAVFDNTGSDVYPDLPFGMQVVKKMTVNNGMTGVLATSDVTTYSYQDGMYDWEDKEFRGFAVVDTVEPNTAKKKYVFHQSDALQGLLAEVQTRDSSGLPFAETENTWSNSLYSGIYTVNLSEEKDYTYDSSASNPKIIRTSYQYDNYGNIRKKSEFGDNDVLGDERFTYSDYTASPSAWIVNTPKLTFVNAPNDSTKVSESLFYYDGHTGLGEEPTKGDVTKEVKWLSGGINPEIKYEYDSYGNVTKVTDPNDNETTYTFDITHTYPESITNAKSQQTNITYDIGTGNILSKTDPNGLTTDYEYDYFGRFTKEIKPYDDNQYPTVFYEYDFDGVAPEGIWVRQREEGGTLNTVDTITYVDGLNRKVQTRADAEDDTKQIVIDTYYDPTDAVLKETVPYLATASATFAEPLLNARGTSTTYDALGRPTIITNPKGGNKTIAYDHWKETETDENYHIKRRYLNAYGKIQKIEELIGVTPHATNYVYNSLDQLTQIIDSASNSATINYDTLGRKTSHVDPDMGTWTYGYDAAGNQTTTTDARSITVSRTYDELNRLTGILYPSDTDVSFAYDTGKIGTLSIATDSAGTVFYTYDNRLRKVQEQRVIGGTSKTTTFAYDSADRLIYQKNPDNTESNYTFNAQGEIETLDGILDNVDYNAQGKITKKEFNNGLDTTYTYNTNDFRLNRIQTGELQDLNYTYDPVGNISSIFNDITDKTQNFTYDDLDRLQTASESAGFSYAYEYDPIGNLTKFTSGNDEIEYEYGNGAGPHAMTSTSGSASGNTEVELLDAPMNLAASSGEDVGEGDVDTNILNGQTTVKVTVDLNGDYFGLGDDEASVVFIQGGEWMAANIIPYLQNGYDGVQTAEVPLSAFYKVNDTEHLDTEGTVSGLRVRFWNDEPFSVDVTSVKVTTNPEPTEMEMLINPWSFVEGTSGDEVKYHDIPAYSLHGKTTARVTFDLHGTSFGLGDDEASLVFLQGEDWMAANIIPYANNGQNGSQTVDIPLSAFEKVFDDDPLNTEADVDQVIMRFWNDEPFTVDVTSVKLLSDAELTGETELLDSPWGLAGEDGDDQEDLEIDGNALNGKTAAKITFDLNGTSFGSGDDEASIVFVQGGEWYAANVTDYGDNGLDGSQTIDIPLTEFRKVNDTELLDPEGEVSNLHTRFWNSGAFSVDITSIKLVGPSASASATYTYDSNGNMTGDGLKQYEYNEANQLKRVKFASNSATLAEYVYDFTGQRVIKKNYTNGSLANTVTSWTKSFETKVIVGGSTETTNYYFANEEVVAKKNPNNSIYYYHNDHLGSTVLITNEAGDLVEESKFDPYGRVLAGATQSKFQYTGQEKDAETGLNYYGARYYDPELMRFTQPDTLIPDAYNPQSLNRYSYTLNNPLKYTDPSGHDVVFRDGKIQSTNTVLNRPQQTQPKQYTASIALNLKHVAAASSKIDTPPQPKNSGGGANGGGNGGGGGSSNSSIKETSYKPQLPEKGNGYVNTGFTVPLRGLWGVGAGAKMDRGGYAPYVNVGPVGKKFGLNLTYSTFPLDDNSGSLDISYAGKLTRGVLWSVSIPAEGAGAPRIESGEVGVGSQGFSATGNYTFEYHEWSVKSLPKFNFIRQVE